MCLSSLGRKSPHRFTQQEGPGARSQSLSPEEKLSRETGKISRHQLRVCEAKLWQSFLKAAQGSLSLSCVENHQDALCWPFRVTTGMLFWNSAQRLNVQSSQNKAASLLCGSNAIFSLSVCGPQGIL